MSIKDATKNNKKTTAAGVVALASAGLYLVGSVLGVEVPVFTDAGVAISTISAGVAALFAGDGDKA